MRRRRPGSDRRRSVVLFGAADTLRGIDPLLRKHGVRLVRIRSVDPRPVAPDRWLPRVRRWGVPDTVVVTSRAGVVAGVRPWAAAARPRRDRLDVWAAGPATATALRAAGFRPVHRPRPVGADALEPALERRSPRRILYFRSDRAGPALGRALRRRGHRVLDPVVYRLGVPRAIPATEQRELAEARLLIVTSPSGFAELERRLSPPAFARLRRSARTVVLGARSLHEARARGFTRLSVAPSTAAQRFTHHLLAELADVLG